MKSPTEKPNGTAISCPHYDAQHSKNELGISQVPKQCNELVAVAVAAGWMGCFRLVRLVVTHRLILSLGSQYERNDYLSGWAAAGFALPGPTIRKLSNTNRHVHNKATSRAGTGKASTMTRILACIGCRPGDWSHQIHIASQPIFRGQILVAHSYLQGKLIES